MWYVSKTSGFPAHTSPQITPMDNVQDLKQFLAETPETCHITNYNLFVNGEQLNEFAEFGDLPQVQANTLLEMKESTFMLFSYFFGRTIFRSSLLLRLLARAPMLVPCTLISLTLISPSTLSHSQLPQHTHTYACTHARTSCHTHSTAPYDEGSMKMHVRRVRELLSWPEMVPQSPSLFAGLTQAAERQTKKKPANNAQQSVDQDSENADKSAVELLHPALSTFYPEVPSGKKNKNAVPVCLRSLAFSGWNPPPSQRRLRGRRKT